MAAAKPKGAVADNALAQAPPAYREQDEHKGVAPSSSSSSAAPSGDTVDDDDDEFAAFLDHDASSLLRPGEPESKERNGGVLLRALLGRSCDDADADGPGGSEAGAVAHVDEPFCDGEGEPSSHLSPDSRGSSRSSGYTDYIGFETVVRSPR